MERSTPAEPPLAELKPYLTITVLECTSDDPAAAFAELAEFLHQSAQDRGRAQDAVARAGHALRAQDPIESIGVLGEFGFDQLVCVSRQVTRPPSWVTKQAGLVDTEQQLTLALLRRHLVAVSSGITSEAALRRWVNAHGSLFRFVSPDVLAGTFTGDGKAIWLRAVTPPRSTKADTKAFTGLRIQDLLNPVENNSYLLSAAKVHRMPESPDAVVRNQLTYSPDRGRLSWQQTPDFVTFLRATAELLDELAKALAESEPPPMVFGGLAKAETDLGRVRFAVDVALADPDQLIGAGEDEDLVEQARLLSELVFDVRGDADSAIAELDVTAGPSTATFRLRPVAVPGGFQFHVEQVGSAPVNRTLAAAREAIGAGGLLTVYYGSGHSCDGRAIYWRELVDTPYRDIRFEDFTGYKVTREKPKAKGDQAIHRAIGTKGDDSLFAWVLRHYSTGWLRCDDGAGEVADFLHLDGGTLTAIHVKAAERDSAKRRIAVHPFEVLVSQAEKNMTLLRPEQLLTRLDPPRISTPAVWHDGRRVGHQGFLNELRKRNDTDRVEVALVQPHLTRAAHTNALLARVAGTRNQETYAMRLLDNLLHTARHTITSQCDEFVVIGSR